MRIPLCQIKCKDMNMQAYQLPRQGESAVGD